jgi:hypothetical protein
VHVSHAGKLPRAKRPCNDWNALTLVLWADTPWNGACDEQYKRDDERGDKRAGGEGHVEEKNSAHGTDHNAER